MNSSVQGAASTRRPLTMGPSTRATPSVFPGRTSAGAEERLTVDIPAGLKKRLKLEAVRRDVTVKTVVIQALERELGANEDAPTIE
ncbi:hypothetical protein [Brachybacterium sp. ACRRE]|uniref:hypothetical protein n=1 Tax=Brachybacterium sp. ACRRE TaxID=2918184 RepID=UPI001EF2B01C|nr:hypothetical protein [Brachybacterium sp. ACRRE]MCG7308272.1 hypothetical protein [Brachybacterium sp. ACRRE]